MSAWGGRLQRSCSRDADRDRQGALFILTAAGVAMKTAFFRAKAYDRQCFESALQQTQLAGFEMVWLEAGLNLETAVLASGCQAVCAFVNDDLSAPVVERLNALGVRMLALCSAGFSHMDLAACRRLGLAVAQVPAYSPYAVAEHPVCLLLTLNRHVRRAWQRVREPNFRWTV